MEKDEISECSSCNTSNRCLVKIKYDECPCRECLIKSMCGHSCVPYSKFFNKLTSEELKI